MPPLALENNQFNQFFTRNLTMKKNLIHIASQLQGTKGRFVLFLLTIALFVLSAGAPNATIGIGK
jgi:hypothetical protein